MSKKIFSVIVIVLIAVFVFAACNQAAAPAQEAATDQPATPVADDAPVADAPVADTPVADGGTLTLVFPDSVPKPGIEAVAAAAKEKLGINLEFDIIAAEGSENILKTRLASGDMGDLFINNAGAQMIVLNPEQNMADLSNEPFASRLQQGFVDVASYNDKLYAIPMASSFAGGILYNKKVYEELGLSVPTTWDEFIANCEKIKAAGKTAIIGSYKEDWSTQLILLGDYYNVQKEVPTFAADFTANKAKYATTPAALRSFEKLASTKDLMNEDYLATTTDVAMDMLANGDGVHWPMLTMMLGTIGENYPDQVNDIGFMPVWADKAGEEGVTMWPSSTIHVYKDSPNADLAKKFLEFYLSDEGIAIYGAAVKATGPFLVNGVDLGDDAFTAVKDMLPYFENDKATSAIEFVTPVKGPNCPQICVAVGSGMNTALEAAELYDKDCEKQAAQLGLEGW